MTSDTQEAALVLIAEGIVALAEAQRAATAALTRAVEEMHAALEAMPAPEVRVAAPIVNIPAVQHVVIDALPPMNARIKRDRSGRMESITED